MWFREHPANPKLIAELEEPLKIPWEHTTEPFDGATTPCADAGSSAGSKAIGAA